MHELAKEQRRTGKRSSRRRAMPASQRLLRQGHILFFVEPGGPGMQRNGQTVQRRLQLDFPSHGVGGMHVAKMIVQFLGKFVDHLFRHLIIRDEDSHHRRSMDLLIDILIRTRRNNAGHEIGMLTEMYSFMQSNKALRPAISRH